MEEGDTTIGENACCFFDAGIKTSHGLSNGEVRSNEHNLCDYYSMTDQ